MVTDLNLSSPLKGALTLSTCSHFPHLNLSTGPFKFSRAGIHIHTETEYGRGFSDPVDKGGAVIL